MKPFDAVVVVAMAVAAGAVIGGLLYWIASRKRSRGR